VKKTRIEVLASARNVGNAALQLSRMPSMDSVRVNSRTAQGEQLVKLEADVFYEDGREPDVLTELSGLVGLANGAIEQVRTHKPEKLPGLHLSAGYRYADMS
jgi:hypothetical protein